MIGNRPGHADPFTQTAANADLPVNAVSQRDGLGIPDVGSGPKIQAAVKFIHCLHRTDLGTLTAPGALDRIDVSGPRAEGHGEIAGSPGNGVDRSVCDHLDI